MALRKWIIVTTEFSALHRWPDAEGSVAFLSHPHRHKFHVEVRIEVEHDDRELEFFTIQQELDIVCTHGWGEEASCEHMATVILNHFVERYDRRCKVEVWEDKENGAMVETVDG